MTGEHSLFKYWYDMDMYRVFLHLDYVFHYLTYFNSLCLNIPNIPCTFKPNHLQLIHSLLLQISAFESQHRCLFLNPVVESSLWILKNFTFKYHCMTRDANK